MSEDNNQPTNEPQIQDAVASAKASAIKAAEDLKAAAAAKAEQFKHAMEDKAQSFKEAAGDKSHEFKDYADRTWEDARAQVQDYAAEAEKFAKEKPLQALLTAFGVGLIAGILLKK